jgi:alpha-amylase
MVNAQHVNKHLLTISQAQLTQCWVGGSQVPLPDLKTSSPRVRQGYNDWIKSLTTNYSIDGLRLDTVLQVEKGFWKGFRDAVNDMYMIGEIFQEGADFVCDYQNYLSGLFNYPVYFPLINAFKSTSGSMAKLSEEIDKTAASCKDISLLGSFSENHDNARFPSQQHDIAQAANVITFTMIADGIPILYQGQEQHYDARGGANDPYNREALWFSGYNTNAQLYKLVANLNKARKNAIRNDPSFLTTKANPIYTDTTTIAVKKGKLMTVLSNKGSSGSNYTQPIRSYYQSGSSVTELLSCTKYISDGGSYINVPMSAGMPRVFYPTADIGTLCGGATSYEVAGASSSADAAAAVDPAAAPETYSESTSSDATVDTSSDSAVDSSTSSDTTADTSASDSTASDSSSSDSTVLDSSMSRPARPNRPSRPSRPNRATRNRARPSRAKLARRSSSGNMKAARWAA